MSGEDELAEYMTEYDRDWYIGTETDHDWQLSIMKEKPSLFSLGRDKGKVGSTVGFERKEKIYCFVNKNIGCDLPITRRP